MKALLYVTKRSLMNNLKRAVRKPATLFLILFCIGYAIFLIQIGITAARKLRFDSAKGLVVLVTIWALYVFFADFLSYASKKGVLFKKGQTHFVFPAPISPKLVLVYSAWMNYIFSVGVNLLFAIAGAMVFGVAWWKMVLFFFLGCGLEIVLECSTMVILYTNEQIPVKVLKGICIGIKVFLIGITLLIVYYFWENGITLETVFAFFDWKILQIIPVVGWNIALYRLLLLGPTMLNAICSVLYIGCAVILFAAAFRMKCGGGYYEEAAKFADDYAEMRKRSKNGEMVMGIGKKKRKFRKVEGEFSAHGARAVFYRQLLEYKKEKYFIFSKMTLTSLFLAAIMSFVMRSAAQKTGHPELFLLGVLAYVTLCMTGYLGKWETELKNPYLFLIPDSPFKKIWYATLMEHVKALADGILICVPVGFVWGIRSVYVVQCILIYTVLQANKLYLKVIAQWMVGELLGKTGQELIRGLMQMVILGLGAGIAVLVGLLIDPDLVFPILLIYSLIVTTLVGLLAAIRFDSMEQMV